VVGGGSFAATGGGCGVAGDSGSGGGGDSGGGGGQGGQPVGPLPEIFFFFLFYENVFAESHQPSQHTCAERV
jgi:hypothetical protein